MKSERRFRLSPGQESRQILFWADFEIVTTNQAAWAAGGFRIWGVLGLGRLLTDLESPGVIRNLAGLNAGCHHLLSRHPAPQSQILKLLCLDGRSDTYSETLKKLN